MNNIKSIASICINQFKNWKNNPRIIFAFIIGMIFSLRACLLLNEYVLAYGKEVQIFEPFVFLLNSPGDICFVFLGYILLIADAPFVCTNNIYCITRVPNKVWLSGTLLYLFLTGIIYYLVILLVCIISFLNNQILLNVWSETFTNLSTMNYEQIVENFNVNIVFSGYELISNFTPFTSAILSFLLAYLYTTIISLIIFVISFNSKVIWGSITGLGLHMAGYIIILEAGYVNPMLSLFARSIPIMNAWGNNIISEILTTILIFLIIIVSMLIIIEKRIKNYDFNCTNIEIE